MSLHAYHMDRRPVLPPDRKEEYTCSICHRLGWGAPNTAAHPGKCHNEHVRQKARKAAEKRKLRRQQEKEAVC